MYRDRENGSPAHHYFIKEGGFQDVLRVREENERNLLQSHKEREDVVVVKSEIPVVLSALSALAVS
jgi:hypothetical protein